MSKEQPTKIIYPDQLNITINTSIPGYQKIIYKPSMSIKDTDEKTIRFNPLIKLNKSTIEKIPKEYKTKQFFNKGLFQSLLIHNGGTPAKSLLQATRSGYIDNNIKITLDSIFPVGSVIYIGKKPYAIGDTQWTNGDWKIDMKQKKEEIDINKVNNPRLYNELVREEIISGEDELNKIPESIRTGINYTGPPVASGIKKQNTPTGTSAPKTSETKNIVPIDPSISSDIIKKPTQETQTQETQTQTQSTDLVQKQNILLPQAITNDTEENEIDFLEETPFVEELSVEEHKLCELFYSSFHALKNNKSINFIRNYFKIGGKSISKFPNIIQKIFLNFNSKMKNEVKLFLRITTNYIVPSSIEAKNLPSISPTAYDKLCDQLDIIEAPTDGNCFFQAVSDSINIYN